MTTSLKFKEKATELDTRSYKCLLLALVKLIHADPKLMLHVSSCQNDSPSLICVHYIEYALCFCVLEPSKTSSGDAEQHSRAHHWPGAVSASKQQHSAVTGSHGGQIVVLYFCLHTFAVCCSALSILSEEMTVCTSVLWD